MSVTLKDIENVVKSVGLQTVTLYGLNMVGLDEFVNRDPSMLTRNLKRGFVWYLSLEAEEQILTGTSNFVEMDAKKLIDDTIFNAISSAVVESTRLNEPVNNVLQRFIPRGELLDNVVTASFIVATRYVGSKMEEQVIRKITSLFS